MELTSILGTSFLVNVDSIVYAYTRGSESTLVMSRSKELVYVTESVAEVVTASGTGLVAFTSTSGDVTGSVAINPNYIQKVTSVDGGDSSGLVLGDSNGISATLVVTRNFADMDSIVESFSGSTITSGTITGTDPVDVSCFAIPTAGIYHVKASVLFSCTDPGSGTTVEGEYRLSEFLWIAVSAETVDSYGDDGTSVGDSIADSTVEPTAVTGGQLKMTFTPPTTADTDTVFAYKIIASGFSL